MKIQGPAVVVIVAVIVAIISGSIGYIAKPSGVTTTTTTTPAPTTTTTPPPANALTLYHWWTSGGEKAAVTALINVFKAEYPDVAVMETAVTGGAGFEMMPVIQSLVLAGQAPDAFQMHAGYEGKPYFDADLLEPIDSLWTSEGLTAVIPEVVQSMCKFDGHFYAVPVNIHRVNVVWYNKSLLDANDIDPDTLTTWDAFFAACDTLHTAGVQYPISLGGTSWTGAHTFETILASEGIDFYERWINGQVTSASDPDLLDALNTFSTYMGYVNPDHATLTWNDATAMIITGESAFNIMGDWANGEFTVAEKTYGTHYGTFAVPGTEDMYGLCIDCFQHMSGVAHPTNSDRWLKVVGSKAGQDAFNPLKGSISARTDADMTKYNAYQQSAIADFTSVTYMFPSVTHGSGAPAAFKVKLADTMSAFCANLDVSAAASALTSYTTEIIDEYTVVWSLD
jgi:glucose/mannose transport system substrate-binding protein